MRWNVKVRESDDILAHLLKTRQLDSQDNFLNPPDPHLLTAKQVGVDENQLKKAIARIKSAVTNKEKVIVYGDYDVDGVCATAIIWETLHDLGADVFPYIPERKKEGYGFSKIGIENIKKKYSPTLVITVDHGITALDHVKALKKDGIDVVVTDHHQVPSETELKELSRQAQCVIHTTLLSGSGIAWFLAKHLDNKKDSDRLALCAFGTIGDVLPLVGVNRQIASYGLPLLSKSEKVGIVSLLQESGLSGIELDPYHIGYILGPRINASGRLASALDALRMLCTKDERSAIALSAKLGSLNRKRQLMTEEQINRSLQQLKDVKGMPSLLIVADPAYDEGIIGLIAGALSRRYYRPAIVISQNEDGISKASARSIPGVDIIKLIRQVEGMLTNAGGHSMAAGFSLTTSNISQVAEDLIQRATDQIEPELLERVLDVDLELRMEEVTLKLLEQVDRLKPFGNSNERPVFSLGKIYLDDVRKIGKDSNHLKLKVIGKLSSNGIDAIGFSKAYILEKIDVKEPVDIAFTLDLNKWNGNESLQLKIKDIRQD